VLDLAPGNSLMAYLAGHGLDVHLVDWGSPTAGDSGLDLAGHVTERLVPMLAELGAPALLVGYCLGGTIAAAAASVAPSAGLVTIAAPWHFSGIDEESRATVAALWKGAEPACRRLGYVPMEVLQAGFWRLDPARTIRKYAGFADFDPASPTALAFMAVEDWANAGAPLTYAAGKSLFEQLYAVDMTGNGKWRIGGTTAVSRPAGLPTLAIASAADLIVPAAASPEADERWTLELGHVGMIVSRKAPQALWQPLAAWLASHAK
jgi:polyhydroxyalkanoate synthase